jgi:hypothetical protein
VQAQGLETSVHISLFSIGYQKCRTYFYECNVTHGKRTIMHTRSSSLTINLEKSWSQWDTLHALSWEDLVVGKLAIDDEDGVTTPQPWCLGHKEEFGDAMILQAELG